MSDIGKSLISAMQQIVDKTIERTPTDVTITATIKRLVEAARNKYEISYGGGIAYAYSDNGTSYIEGQAVYVLVPQGDYTNKKIILGKAQEEYGDDTLADDLTAMNIGYNSIGGNLLEKSENSTTIELDAGKKQDIVFLYGSETFIKNEFGDKNLDAPYTLDLDSISNSIKLADYLMITMDINTALGASLRKSVTGKYGLRVAVIYNDPLGKEEVTKFYSLTDKDMFGNPMKYEQGSTQHIIFPIEKENFIRIEYIYAYCEDFVEEDLENSVSKIYFKNIQLQLLTPITSKNGDYYLQLKMPKGNTFKIKTASEENSPPEEADILEIVSSTYYKKNSISDSCDHYWGIEDFSIDYNSKGYNKFLGNGWKLLTTSNTSFLKVFRKDNTAYQNNYICVSVYNDNGTNIVLRETFSIFNDDNKIDILIESDCGTSFSFNSGTPRLTCRAFIPAMIDGEEKNIEIGSEEAYPFSDYRYNWTKEDADGIVSFTKTPEQWKTEKELFLKEASENENGIDSQGRTALQITAFYNNEIAQAAGILEKQDNYIKYSMKNIPATTNSTVFKCSIQKRKGSTSDWLNAGSASITLNNDILGNNNCQIVIENGTQTFQYSETGISPASEKNQNPIEIRPLRAKFFTANGEEVPESRLNFIRWIIPSESTMINVSSDALTQDPLSGEQYVTSSTLDFSISEIYNLNTINNQIVCSIGFDGKVYRQPTNFFFTKIGQVGTNGTQTTVKIEEINALPDRYSAIIVKPNGSANSISYSATLFTHNEKLFGYSPKWSIAGSDTKESRYIKIDEENNISLTEKNKNKEDVRIVTAKIPYEGKTYYSSYPVYTITLNADASDDFVYIKKPNTLQFITYNSNGTNPQFNTAQGGIFLNVKTDKNYYVEWSALGGKDDKNPAITLSRTGNSNIGSFIISEKTIKEEDKVISEIAKIKSFIQENLDSILTQEIKDKTEIFILNFFNQLNDSFYSLEANLIKCREMSNNFKIKIESYEEGYFKNSINYANRVCSWLEDLLVLVENYIEATKEKNNAKNNTKNKIEKIFNSLLVESKEEVSEQLKTQNEAEDTVPKSDKDLYIIEYQKLLNELCNIYEYNLYKKIYDIVKEDDKDFGEYRRKLLPREDFKKILEATNVDKNYDTRELNDRFKEEIEKLRTSFESIVLEFDDITPPWFEKLVYIEKIEEESEYKEHSIFIVPAETYNGIYCNNRIEAKIMETENDGTEKILATVVIPIHLSLNAYELASVNGWDGTHIEINEEEGYLLSPQLGAGVKNPETNSFTGLVMGSISNKTEEGYSSEKVGLMGFSEGRQSIFLDAKTGAAEFGLAEDGADSNDPYSEGRIKLVPNGVSEISKWRIGSKSLFNVKEGNISDAYLDLKQFPLDKNGYEKSVPHDKMGILMSADPSYISIKGKQLFENSGIDFNNANAVIKPGDTMELQLDPNQFSLFTVFRHTSKIDGISDYKLKTTKKNNKIETESKDVLYRDSAADEEKMISVYAYSDKKDETKTVYFKELVFPNEECKIKLDDNSKDETDGFYYPEKNKENNKYIYEYDGSNIEIPLIYMGEEADLKKIKVVDNSNEHIIITLADGTKLSFLKEQFNFDPIFYLDNNNYFIHFYHEKDLLFLKTEEYIAKEIIVEDSLLPNPIEEKHIGKYFYDKEKNLYLINKECNEEIVSVEESLLPESLGEKEENKYYYDKENKLYLIVKEIVKEEKPIEKIFLPKTLNQEHIGKYYYTKQLYLIIKEDNEVYNKKEVIIENSLVPNVPTKNHLGKYYYDSNKNLYLINYTKKEITIEESSVPSTLTEKNFGKYYYDSSKNNLYLIVKNYAKKEVTIEKSSVPSILNKNNLGKYYYDSNKKNLYLIVKKDGAYKKEKITIEASSLPDSLGEKHVNKYYYDKENKLYLIVENYVKKGITIQDSYLPYFLNDNHLDKYYYDNKNNLYLIVKEIAKEKIIIEKSCLPYFFNDNHNKKYYYGKGELCFVDKNCNTEKIDIKDSSEKCNVGDYYYKQKRYYHHSRETKEGLKTYCLPYSSCSVQYANPDAEVGKKLELYKTFNEDSALLVIPEECIFESEFKFVNQVLIEEDNEGRSIGRPAWRREPKVGIDANGRFYTNSLKDNSTALTIGNLGAFGESAADKKYIGAAFEIESNDGNSSNLLKIFTDKKTAESSNSLETTPIYISASGNVDNEYTKPISFYGERISLNAIPNSKEKNSKNGAQSKLNLGIIEEGKTTTSPFARIQSDKNSFLELKGTGGLRSFSLKAENEGTDNILSTSIGIQRLTPPSTKVNLDTLEKDGKKLSKLKKQITQEEYNKLSEFTRKQIESVENLKSNLIGNENNLKNLSNSTLKAIQKIVLILVKKEVPDSLTLQSSLFSNPVNFATDKKSFLSLHYEEARLSVKNGNKLLLEQIGSETNKLLFNSNGINLSSSTVINIQNNANISITSGEKNKQIGGKILILGNKASKPSGSTSQKQNTADKSIVNNDLFENGTGKAYLSLRGYNGVSQAAYLLSNGGTYILPTLYTDHNSSSASSDGKGVWYVDIAPNVNIPSSGHLLTGNLAVREKNDIILKNGNNAFYKKWDKTVYSPSISLSSGSYAITATITAPELTVGPSSKNTLSVGSSSPSDTISLAYIQSDIASVRSYADSIKNKLNALIKHYNSHVHSFHYSGGRTAIEEKHSHGFVIGATNTSAHTSDDLGTL